MRTFGAVDKHPRKHRSDKGKHRKFYDKKPVKGKRFKKFEKRIGNKEYIKIWIWQRIPMSSDGLRRFNRYVRRYMKKEVTRMLNVHLVHVSEINTKEKIEEFMANNYWAGTFLIMGFSNAKNKYHCKPVKICKVLIRETEYGNHARIINNYRLGRYSWFYKD